MAFCLEAIKECFRRFRSMRQFQEEHHRATLSLVGLLLHKPASRDLDGIRVELGVCHRHRGILGDNVCPAVPRPGQSEHGPSDHHTDREREPAIPGRNRTRRHSLKTLARDSIRRSEGAFAAVLPLSPSSRLPLPDLSPRNRSSGSECGGDSSKIAQQTAALRRSERVHLRFRIAAFCLALLPLACEHDHPRPRAESDVRCTLTSLEPVPGAQSDPPTWVAHLRIVNGTPSAVGYQGYSPRDPIYEAETLKDGAWTSEPMGFWCGTGLHGQSLRTGEAVEIQIFVPADRITRRFRFGKPAVVTPPICAPR